MPRAAQAMPVPNGRRCLLEFPTEEGEGGSVICPAYTDNVRRSTPLDGSYPVVITSRSAAVSLARKAGHQLRGD